jgi:tetratricopeptide (TPR) repeat protein
MKRSQREAAARGSTHLLRLSLPAVRSNGSFEGADILAEAGAVPAILLCQVYRGVMAWALTPAAEHEGLFPPHAAAETRRLMAEVPVAAELLPALEAVCDLLGDPAGADARRVAEACARIGEWAERKGDAPATALRFLQAAGTCLPNDAGMAYRAGSVARHQALWDVADLWFRHGVAVGRRTRDWEGHATAYLALGNSYTQRGRYASGKREHLKALRVSKRHGLRELQGKAYHDLLIVSIELREWLEAEGCAQKAFYAYGPTHPNVRVLAHDVAYLWNIRGYFLRALPVFRALLPHFDQPQARIRVLAGIGRAAGGASHREQFLSAWNEVQRITPAIERFPSVPASLLQITYGAAALQEWEIAERGGEYALRTALDRGEADIVAEAEQTLASIRNRVVPGERMQTRARDPFAEAAETLAEDLVASLEAAGP